MVWEYLVVKDSDCGCVDSCHHVLVLFNVQSFSLFFFFFNGPKHGPIWMSASLFGHNEPCECWKKSQWVSPGKYPRLCDLTHSTATAAILEPEWANWANASKVTELLLTGKFSHTLLNADGFTDERPQSRKSFGLMQQAGVISSPSFARLHKSSAIPMTSGKDYLNVNMGVFYIVSYRKALQKGWHRCIFIQRKMSAGCECWEAQGCMAGLSGEGLHLPSSFFPPPVRHSAVTHTLYLELQTCTYLRVLTVRCSFFVSGYLQYYQKRENTYK